MFQFNLEHHLPTLRISIPNLHCQTNLQLQFYLKLKKNVDTNVIQILDYC